GAGSSSRCVSGLRPTDLVVLAHATIAMSPTAGSRSPPGDARPLRRSWRATPSDNAVRTPAAQRRESPNSYTGLLSGSSPAWYLVSVPGSCGPVPSALGFLFHRERPDGACPGTKGRPASERRCGRSCSRLLSARSCEDHTPTRVQHAASAHRATTPHRFLLPRSHANFRAVRE